jgi:hypothetical protein
MGNQSGTHPILTFTINAQFSIYANQNVNRRIKLIRLIRKLVQSEEMYYLNQLIGNLSSVGNIIGLNARVLPFHIFSII